MASAPQYIDQLFRSDADLYSFFTVFETEWSDKSKYLVSDWTPAQKAESTAIHSALAEAVLQAASETCRVDVSVSGPPENGALSAQTKVEK
jgi:hypothetical protein